MVSAAVGVLGPLTFVIVLELARLAREVPIVGPDEETERIDYGSPEGRVERGIRWLATRFGYSQSLVTAGGFFVVFLLTELVLYGSVFAVYSAQGPVFETELSSSRMAGAGVLLFLVLLWVSLPVIVVDQYDEFTAAGIEPFSVNVHVTTTLVYVLFLVVSIEIQPVLPAGVTPDTLELGRSLVGGVLGGMMAGKSGLFYRTLRAEIEQFDRSVEADTDGIDASTATVEADATTAANEGTEPSDE